MASAKWYGLGAGLTLGLLLHGGAPARGQRAALPPAHRAPTAGVPCTDVAFSPDGKYLAAARHRQVLLLDATAGRTIAVLSGHAGPLTSVAFRPDGRVIAAGGGVAGQSAEIRLWDVAGRSVIRVLKGAHTDRVQGLAWSPDGRTLAAASYDRLVSLCDTESGRVRTLKDHTDAVYAVAFSPDGARLATASGDRTVKVWEPATGRRLYTLGDATAELYCVAYSPDGRTLAAGGADRSLRIWNVTPGAGSLRRSAFAHDQAVLRVRFAPDGRRIFTTGEDRSLKEWGAETLAEQAAYPGHPDWPLGLAVSPDGKAVALGSHAGTVTLRRTQDGKIVW